MSIVLIPGGIPLTTKVHDLLSADDLVFIDNWFYSDWSNKGQFKLRNKDVLYNEMKLPKVNQVRSTGSFNYEEMLLFVFNDYNLWHILERKDNFESLYDSDVLVERLAVFALSILKQDKIDRVIIFETPHAPFDYVFCRVAEFLKIEVNVIKQSAIPWRSLITKGIQGNEPIKLPFHGADSNDRALLKDYLHTKTTTYESAIPTYEKERYDKFNGKIWSWKVELNKVLSNRDKSIPISFLESRSKYKSYRRYVEQEVAYDFNKRNVVFFLHYQPERTTLPEGGIFNQQILAIQQLRQILPNDITIYVKEHPSTYRNFFKYKTRTKKFYETISALANIKLVSMETNTFELIDYSLFVATITGTVAIEAACRGRVAVYFGNSVYQNLPGTIHFNELLGSSSLMEEIINQKHDFEFSEVEEYFHELLDYSAGDLSNDKDYYSGKDYYNSAASCLAYLLLDR
ncbi:capsular polysaccharide export protein, LipB/KpsS family [Roseivirga echinicomitans]|uniref:Capsular biosynthesis protein n=1 Tax=Roseivirga echinicomitans TaxID=296218 RepID=A0A150XW47_9BACT|nr:hypothetical protein [Roseivirga echinicomitans]KYG82855.1 hypothetical protein AWN68_13810 [Roseivirga echinicomitans]